METYKVEVENWCVYCKGMIRLILECNEPQFGILVKGKPVFAVNKIFVVIGMRKDVI
ncbi:MAG: hypothetical protein QW270_05725 [Candidatus Bathyarchaeia archaeon]